MKLGKEARRWGATLGILLVAGCGASDRSEEPPPEDGMALGLNLGAVEEVATGIDVPWGLAFLPGGDALVGERATGRILRVGQGRDPEEVRVIPEIVVQIEGGLLGLALSPNFDVDNLVYAYYTTAYDSRIVRFALDAADTPPQVVFAGITRGPGHSGGRIAFGPDGMLYATVGDGTFSDRAQDMASLNGKILRLTPDGQVAPGNPFGGSPIYSIGHRNPQGIAWDAQGRLYEAEFGDNGVDEINLIESGRDYGWPMVEGVGDTMGGRFSNPLREWSVADASPSGIAVRGDTLVMAALRGERLWTVPP